MWVRLGDDPAGAAAQQVRGLALARRDLVPLVSESGPDDLVCEPRHRRPEGTRMVVKRLPARHRSPECLSRRRRDGFPGGSGTPPLSRGTLGVV